MKIAEILIGIVFTFVCTLVCLILFRIGARELWVYKNRNARTKEANRLLWKLAHSH